MIFPFDVEREFGAKGHVLVKATFNDVPYAGSLMKCGKLSHMLGVLKGIREQIGKRPGNVIDVVVWKDEAERILDVPAEFERRLKADKAFRGGKAVLYARKGILSLDHRSQKRRNTDEPNRKGCCDVTRGHEDPGIAWLPARGENAGTVQQAEQDVRHLTQQPAFARLRVAAGSAESAEPV